MAYNSQTFTPEETKKGLHLDLIKYLLDYNQKSDTHYNDIHITTDGSCIIVEWECVPYSREYGGRFEHLEKDETKMKEMVFPDNHSEFVFPEEEKDRLTEWLKTNPDYVLNPTTGHYCYIPS